MDALDEVIAGLGARPIGDTEAQQAEMDWMEARRGMLTASRFDVLMSSGRRKDEPFSETAKSYLYEKVAERLGGYVPGFKSRATDWGHEYEPHAIQEYASRTQQDVQPNTHKLLTISKWVGGTPDFLVGNSGVGEVKCPFNPGVHQRTIATNTVPKEYVWQCHGHLLVTGRDWCDFISFDPRLPEDCDRRLHIIRVDRNETMLKSLRAKLQAANEFIEKAMG